MYSPVIPPLDAIFKAYKRYCWETRRCSLEQQSKGIRKKCPLTQILLMVLGTTARGPVARQLGLPILGAAWVYVVGLFPVSNTCY